MIHRQQAGAEPPQPLKQTREREQAARINMVFCARSERY